MQVKQGHTPSPSHHHKQVLYGGITVPKWVFDDCFTHINGKTFENGCFGGSFVFRETSMWRIEGMKEHQKKMWEHKMRI